MNLDNKHNKQQPFGVPTDYFESFQDSLDARLAEEQLRALVKDPGFSLPETYLSTFEVKQESESANKGKVISLFSTRTVATIAAVAACLVLVFTVFNVGPKEDFALEDISTTTLENYLESDAVEFTNDELTAYLGEEELTLSDSGIESNITNDVLEDYILDNIDSEDLFIQYEE